MRRLFVCGLILLAFNAVSLQSGVAAGLRGGPPPRSPQAGPEHPLTLKQAWRIALRHARVHWSSQALMAELASIDAPGDTIRSGRGGRRRSWTATIIAGNKPGAQLRETIVDGRVVEARSAPFPAPAPPMNRIPRIDSSAAIHVALRTRPDVGPGQSREHGYGFVAHRDARGAMIVAVMGGYRDDPAQVDVDARSGRVLGALLYTFPSSVLFSHDDGRRWRRSNLIGGFVGGIAAVPGSPGSGYAVETGSRVAQLWKTGNGGGSWTSAGALPAAVTSAHGLVVEHLAGSVVIAVGTNIGLWYSSNGGRSWLHGVGLPAGVVQWLAPGWLNGRRALLASVFMGSGRGGTYASTGLRVWRKIISEAEPFSVSANDRATMAFSEDNPGMALLNTRGEVAHRIALPLPALSEAGQFAPGGVQLAQAPDRVMLSEDGGMHWATVLNRQTTKQSLDQVVVSPTFPADGVALVAGFNGGMFRSSDVGKKWQKVENFPATADDEVGLLAFLQTSQVVAVSTDPGTWQPF